MRDRASVNNLAMQTVRVVYPFVVDIGCFSHTLDHVGQNFKTCVLSDFMHSWITLQPQSKDKATVEVTSRAQHGHL